MHDHVERLDVVLGAMAAGPRNLKAYLVQPGPDFQRASDAEVSAALDMLLSADPNHPARLRFSNLVRSWDNTRDAKWVNGTARNTADRRQQIHQQLGSDPDLQERIDSLIPYFPLDEPVVIAEDHEEWYSPQAGVRDYYWRTYTSYLRTRRDWGEKSVLSLDNTTRAIVECLANPVSTKAYASRGLVMGYVQSGKTANFMGVVARAADAGYRLIIVLAGTWNILRNQTQRRFDKELLGKELLKNDESYSVHPPSDWSEFLEHGADPREVGQYTWQRLTRPDIDFRRLKAAIDTLEFDKVDRSLPIYDSVNLHHLPVKLLVIKKHSLILSNLVRDLRLLRTKLVELPTLIIDDESDQAGVNTVDPQKPAKEPGEKERSKTNERMVELLGLFPRGQYVGYTATPYANALVDPDDPLDLFPKDFIVSLERPVDYMGITDFFEPASVYEDLDANDFSLAEIAFIRRVANAPDADDEDLKKALRSYVLSGAIKLYRLASNPSRYRPQYFRHHTMLVHTSALRGTHASLAARLADLWDECAFNSPKGLTDLEQLWTSDFSRVCVAKGAEELSPRSFEDLVPHLSETLKRVERGPKVFLVLNSDSSDLPDFSENPVWKIVIGGNKLSRGYTIEGLTVSYYRRVAGNADTLMQMGRWFGFRPGYRDLVRVFLGVKEGRQGDTDLVALFKEACLIEERFRDEIRRYLRRPGAALITPKQVPPIISISGSLPPTSGNKMFNARIVSKNFGGRKSMLTKAPIKEGVEKNLAALEALLRAGKPIEVDSLGGKDTRGVEVAFRARVFEVSVEGMVRFLRDYHWLEAEFKHPDRPAEASLQIEFLERGKHGIKSWLVVAPQRKGSFGKPHSIKGVCDLSVKERHRVVGGGRFQVFGEPKHRTIAEYLAAIEAGARLLGSPNTATKGLQHRNRGICLLYPVREKEGDKLTVGFELVYPNNKQPDDIGFSVIRKGDSVVIRR